MVNIPEELIQAIQSGDCVLWAGAGFGGLCETKRPDWETLLGWLVARCPASERPQLLELMEQGRLRTV
ncbi:MAG: hypothetical protein ACPG77_18735, partial [Nannocystaceae bacterium]